MPSKNRKDIISHAFVFVYGLLISIKMHKKVHLLQYHLIGRVAMVASLSVLEKGMLG